MEILWIFSKDYIRFGREMWIYNEILTMDAKASNVNLASIVRFAGLENSSISGVP